MKTISLQEWEAIQAVLNAAADLFTDVYPVNEGAWATDYKMVQASRLAELKACLAVHDTVTGNGDLWK